MHFHIIDMAEGPNVKRLYMTRSRKRSRECAENGANVSTALETPEEQLVVDLTEDDNTDKASPLNLSKQEVAQDDKTSSPDLPKEESDNASHVESGSNKLECAICLQTCIHPVRLPCKHIFCFLCVKGAAHGNKKCAMCRSPIPHNYFNNPELLETPEELAKASHEGYEWFYEGRHGWWQYDPRTTKEIEFNWDSGVSQCELLIAGYLYIIDFKEMYQYRKCQPTKRRKIKRDLASVEKLGVAGLRDPNAPQYRRHSEGDKEPGSDEFNSTESPPDTPRRASFDSTSRTFLDFLQDQFAELSLHSDEEDAIYQ